MTLPIQDLEPDFYIAVDYPIDQGKPTNQATKNLEKLIDLLYDKGFAAQIRQGDLTQLLVFVKLSSYKFSEEAEKDLIKNYEFGVTAKDDLFASKLRIIYNYLTNPVSCDGCGLTPQSGEWKFINSIVPITDAFLETTFVEDLKTNVLSQPPLSTNEIKHTYGTQIALYFEFIKHYSFWLVLLSILGLFSYVRQNQRFLMAYSITNLIWGAVFLSSWHRREQHLVNSWGVQNCHLIEDHNTELARVNEKYEEKSTYFHSNNSDGIRFFKQLAFIPIALGFTAVLVSYQLACFCIEIFLTDIYNGPGKSLLTLLPTVLISVFVPILTIVYNAVTNIVIKWENHDNAYSKNNSILVKTFVLNFLTGYVPLIITSFIYLPFAHLVQPHLGDIKTSIASYVGENRFYSKYLLQLKNQQEFQINQGRLNNQFFYFIFTNQVIQMILKYALPLILRAVFNFIDKVQKKPTLDTKNDNPDEAVWLHNVRLSLKLPEYNVDDDFRGLVMQFGYLALFGPVWPLASIVCIVFNVIFFKLDTFKLLNGKYFKPPVPKRVDSIHPWNWALFLLAWIGSIISPVVTSFYRHGTAPPKTLGQFAFDKASIHVSSTVALVLLMFACEHGFLVLSYALYKLSSLFKSQIEWENDFVDNDIKLRHDYYSGKVKPTFKVHPDERWDKFTVASTLDFSTPKSSVPTTDEKSTPVETIGETNKGYLTSAEKSSTTVTSRSDKSKIIEEKEALLKEKENELNELEKSRKELENFKDPTDNVITSKSSADGKPVFSTIDNNTHISDIEKKTVDAAESAVAATTAATAAAVTAAGATNSSSSSTTAAPPTVDPPTVPAAKSVDTPTTLDPAKVSTPTEVASVNSKSSSSVKAPASVASSNATGNSPARGSSLKDGVHKTKKKVSDVVHSVEDNADYKKFVSEAEKEAKKSKSGLKKLFKK
ncbi:MAG: anoctamin [Asgard group archaeon]|nr:anoctamin [Asgard group archaeon]